MKKAPLLATLLVSGLVSSLAFAWSVWSSCLSDKHLSLRYDNDDAMDPNGPRGKKCWGRFEIRNGYDVTLDIKYGFTYGEMADIKFDHTALAIKPGGIVSGAQLGDCADSLGVDAKAVVRDGSPKPPNYGYGGARDPNK